MRYSITVITKCIAEHEGGGSNRLIETQCRLEPSKNLSFSAYVKPDGTPTKSGSEAMTVTLIQGLVGNIHVAHQKGYRDSAEHLRYIIAELEKGFIAVADVGTGTMDAE